MRTSSVPIAALCTWLVLACSEPPPPAMQPLKLDAPAHTPTGSPQQQASFGRLPDAGTAHEAMTPLREAESNAPASVETCADDWLGRHRLNPYGDPPGTMYPGATPLFNEQTGQRTARMDFLFARHPDLAAACAPTTKAAPGADGKH